MSILRYGIVSQSEDVVEITVDFDTASANFLSNTDMSVNVEVPLGMTGRVDGIVFTLNFSYTISMFGAAAAANLQYRKNSDSFTTVSSSAGSGTFSITSIDYNDTVDIKFVATVYDQTSYANVSAEIDSGTVTIGTATVTVGSPYTFSATAAYEESGG